MESRTCFSFSHILAGDELDLMEDVEMLVDNGCIAAFGRFAGDFQRVDLRGKLAVPMFVDAHTHLGDTGAKELGTGLPLVQAVNPPDGLKHRFLESLDRETHIAQMRHGLEEMLRNGIIACGDFREQGLEGVRRLRKASEGLPIHVKALGRIEERAEFASIIQAGREILDEADGLGVRDAESYDSNDLKILRKEFSQKIFAVHATENREADELCKQQGGLSETIRALDWGAELLIHLVHANLQDLEAVAQAGAIAVTCPRSNGVLGNGIPDLAAWVKAGIPFAMGTDNVMLAAPDMLREMDFASRITRGIQRDPVAMDHRVLLKAATINGARALHLEDQLGSLKPGKDASFIVFDLQSPNLYYSCSPSSSIVHRADRADIFAIYILGKPYQPV